MRHQFIRQGFESCWSRYQTTTNMMTRSTRGGDKEVDLPSVTGFWADVALAVRAGPKAPTSIGSPSGVPVPCKLTKERSLGRFWATVRAFLTKAVWAGPLGAVKPLDLPAWLYADPETTDTDLQKVVDSILNAVSTIQLTARQSIPQARPSMHCSQQHLLSPTVHKSKNYSALVVQLLENLSNFQGLIDSGQFGVAMNWALQSEFVISAVS